MAYGLTAPLHSEYPNRAALAAAGVHRNRQGGIAGGETASKGAESVLLAGGYEDDEDHGSFVLYTGHGGRDANTGKQIADQDFTRLNRSLFRNVQAAQPVRLVRKLTANLYRFDGLFDVTDAYDVIGKSGFRICRYELSDTSVDSSASTSPTSNSAAPRIDVTTSRVVRDTAQSRAVKALYAHCCQICGESVPTKNGFYAEGAHIRPLGRPHNGPDDKSNILCLCPTHHVQLDRGGLYVSDDLIAYSWSGEQIAAIEIKSDHSIDSAHLAYMRKHFGYN